jgi:hypothetical protein
MMYSNRSDLIVNHYNLEQDEVYLFENFWYELESSGVKNRSFINIALKRLGYALERSELEDKIIDLQIAAEALFLSNNNNKSELNYRLSMYAAFFLEGSGEKRSEVFKHFRAAYNIRSRIVHGEVPDLPKVNGISLSLQEFADINENYIRKAFHKIVSIAAKNPQPNKDQMKYVINDWEKEFIFKSFDSSEFEVEI